MPTHNAPPDNTVAEEPKFFQLSQGAQVLKPQKLIAIYKLEGDGKSYLEYANVDSKGRVLSFAPMTAKQIENFASALARRQTPDFTVHGSTVGRIMNISVTGNIVALSWKREPGIAEVAYNKELGLSDGEINTPGMIFCYTGFTLYVWAYKEYKGLKTALYHLPFHNVYDDGRICMGNSRTKYLAKDTLDSYCNRWEWLFFHTAGSEIHHPDGFGSNINILHKNLREGAPFPTDDLILYKRFDKVKEM